MRNSVAMTRRSAGLSLTDLARATGLSRLTIRVIERDEGHAPSGTVQLRLAEALGTTVQDLFWSEPAESEPVEAAAS